MDLVWIVPAALALVGGAVVAGLARRAAEEAAGLQRDLRRFGELRPAVVEVRELTAETIAAARRLQQR